MRPYDEAFGPDGDPRPHYAGVLPDAPARAAAEATRRARALGIATSRGPLPVDPVARVLTAAEWRELEAGLTQRARALDLFVTAVYAGEREPPTGCVYFEPELVRAPPPPWSLGIVGFDVVRLPDGSFSVLEDNVLTPGHAAVAAAREIVPAGERAVRPVHDGTCRLLRSMLGAGRPALLGDDPPSWELRRLSRDLQLPLVGIGDDFSAFDVLWQRTARDRLHELPALRGPLLDGTLRVVNRIGCGVADDKRLFAHVPDLVRELLGEEPSLAQVHTSDVARAHVEAPEGWVFKPRYGSGGRGIVVGGPVPGDLRDWVVQERVELSTHPTVVGDGLEPRRVDLRLFAVRDGDAGFALLPGGVSRFAAGAGNFLVNTSAGGGIKDVWVLQDDDEASR